MQLADVLFGYAAPRQQSLKNRIVGLIALQRVAVVIMGLPLALGAAVLAGVRSDDPRLGIGLFSMWLIVASMHTLHDVIDSERDKQMYPSRPVPSGLISRPEATLYGVLMASSGLLMAGFVFNWLCAAIALAVIVLGCINTAYIREKIGYLNVAWIAALTPVGAWAAISPQTTWTLMPWLLFGFVATHQVAMMIADNAEEAYDPTVKAFLIRPRPHGEVVLFITAVITMLLLGIVIFFLAQLHLAYVAVLSAITVWALNSAKYLAEPRSFEKGKKAFMNIANYSTIYWASLAIVAWIL
jgi:protoheme IX farnesyltransferase